MKMWKQGWRWLLILGAAALVTYLPCSGTAMAKDSKTSPEQEQQQASQGEATVEVQATIVVQEVSEVATEQVADEAVEQATEETTEEATEDKEAEDKAEEKEEEKPVDPKAIATHEQVGTIAIPVGERKVQIHSFCLDAKGNLLATCGGEHMTYAKTENGYEPQLVSEDAGVKVLSPEGELLATWPLKITPQAINVGPDGSVYVGGQGKLAKLDATGKVIATADTPNAAEWPPLPEVPDEPKAEDLDEEGKAKLKAEAEAKKKKLQELREQQKTMRDELQAIWMKTAKLKNALAAQQRAAKEKAAQAEEESEKKEKDEAQQDEKKNRKKDRANKKKRPDQAGAEGSKKEKRRKDEATDDAKKSDVKKSDAKKDRANRKKNKKPKADNEDKKNRGDKKPKDADAEKTDENIEEAQARLAAQFEKSMNEYRRINEQIQEMTQSPRLIAMRQRMQALRKRAVNGLAVTEKHVFVVCPATKGYGYDVWRADLDFTSPKKVASGFRGCCGQMDIQASGDMFYIAENSRKRVVCCDNEGKEVRAWGSGSRDAVEGFGSCCNPMNVRVGPDGNIYTSEASVGRIKRFTPEGEFLGVVGQVTIVPGCKHVAMGVSPDGQSVYMLDITRSHIVVMKKKDLADTSSESPPQAEAAKQNTKQLTAAEQE